MTVTYGNEVANVRLGGFGKMLLKWRGSVYKLFWREFIIWSACYSIISFCYRAGAHRHPNSDWKTYFDHFCMQVNRFTDMIPMSFILGFYVSIVVGRWWQQFMNIPWPDRNMMVLNLYLRHHKVASKDEDICCSSSCSKCQAARIYRRRLIRWLNLASVLTFRDVSVCVKDRFPSLDHVVSAGFMTQAELNNYETTKTIHLKYWIPFIWFVNTLVKCRQQELISSEFALRTIIDEMNTFRGCCGMLQSYDWISIPLVYTQVVCVAVYGFFLSCLFGRQYLVNTSSNVTNQVDNGYEFDFYIPVYTLLQFFFYMGWLKVAEQLINPFGSDDDDFDMNLIIDRNLEVSFLAIDNLSGYIPPEDPDIWEDKDFAEAPYTAEAAEHKKAPYLGSTTNIGQNENAEFLPMESLYELVGKSANNGFNSNFLDSMNSIRSRTSARRRLLSQRVTDSGLELEKRYDSPNDGVNPIHSNSMLGSGSTYSRSRIHNPYQKPMYSPQYSVDSHTAHERHNSTRSEAESERIPLIPGSIQEREETKVDMLEHQPLEINTAMVSPDICDMRIIEAVQADGELAQIEVPAPPTSNEVQLIPQPLGANNNNDLIVITDQSVSESLMQ